MTENLPAKVILVIDDEMQIQRFLKVSLESHQYRVLEALSGVKGLEIIAGMSPDLIIMNLVLPDIPSFKILTEISENVRAPVIILSSRNEEATIVKALELGAYDYLTKPFAMSELLFRIQNCFSGQVSSPLKDEPFLFRSGHLEVNISTHEVFCHGKICELTDMEYELLKVLTQYAGRVITHQQLLTHVWGPKAMEHHHQLRHYVAHLRQKIEERPTRPKLIITETGVGYRLRIIPTVI